MRLHVPALLRWADLDAYGHVNNAAMVRLLEQVRIDAFWRVDGEDGIGPALIDGSPTSDTLSLIAHQEFEYLAPVPFLRRPLDAEVWIGELGGASLTIAYQVWSPAGVEPRTLYTRAETTLVLVDRTTGKPRRITERERAEWSPYVEEPIRFRR